MKKILLTALSALILGVATAPADTLLESYQAVLSSRDHYNSDGDRLTNAAAIIRQDRANFHKFNKRDQGDETDKFFSTAENREILEKLLNRGKSTKSVINTIVNKTPTVLVEVYEDSAGDNYIEVSIVE